MMRIGIDATCWANPRGYGRFTRELMRQMVAQAPHHTFVCFLDDRANAVFDLAGRNIERRVVALSASPTIAAAADGNRSPLDMLRLTWAVARARLDVFFCPASYTYFPLPPCLPAVVTVHDAIADRYPELTLPSWRARLFWRIKVLLALAQARTVLTVSEFASREIQEVLGVPPRRIRVAVEAPAPTYRASVDQAEMDAALAKYDLTGRRWFTYVGGFNPHKNVDVLVRAHAALVRQLGAQAPLLVLVGPSRNDVFHSDEGRIAREIDAAGTHEQVRWLGFVADDELRTLHAGALALVLPSACEGFGLPAVEAAAAGAPVIATTASPLPALLEGGGLFVSPGDEQTLLAALHAMATDESTRQRLARRARERASELTWDRTARAALAAIDETL